MKASKPVVIVTHMFLMYRFKDYVVLGGRIVLHQRLGLFQAFLCAQVKHLKKWFNVLNVCMKLVMVLCIYLHLRR